MLPNSWQVHSPDGGGGCWKWQKMGSWRVLVATQHVCLQDWRHQDPFLHQAESSSSWVLAVGPVLLMCFLQLYLPDARSCFPSRRQNQSCRMVRQQWTPGPEVWHLTRTRSKLQLEGGVMSGCVFGSIPSLEEIEIWLCLYKSTAASRAASYPLSKARTDDF